MFDTLKIYFFSVLFYTAYSHKFPLAFLLQVKDEQPKLTMCHSRRLGLSYQRTPTWDDTLGSLLIIQNVKLVFKKMALKTSRTAFVFTRQTCTAILAVTFPCKKYKTYAYCYKTAPQNA